MENPIKMDDLGARTIFGNTHIVKKIISKKSRITFPCNQYLQRTLANLWRPRAPLKLAGTAMSLVPLVGGYKKTNVG